MIRVLAALLALSLLAASCGDDDPVESSTADDMAEDDMAGDDMAELGTIVDVAVANGSFTILVAAAQAAGLVDTLSGDGPFTVFAPTDDAFADLLEVLGVTAEELLADTELLTAVLTYHVIAGEVPSTTVVTLDGQTAATVNGADVTISVEGEAVQVNEANVVAVDVAASNGIIHVIDSVLLPPG
ncbi:MAG: fasciclin domain-containing protein [Acidimicrobiaceae bacterium]|nr:fasciclin domain-containing protein [Acidimicrobiaceae bacterium]